MVNEEIFIGEFVISYLKSGICKGFSYFILFLAGLYRIKFLSKESPFLLLDFDLEAWEIGSEIKMGSFPCFSFLVVFYLKRRIFILSFELN